MARASDQPWERLLPRATISACRDALTSAKTTTKDGKCFVPLARNHLRLLIDDARA